MTQNEALDILKTGANVFLTGEPGAGKTYTINEYIRYLREHEIETAITASTGIAATHIGGMTIHSWSGIGIKNKLTKYDLDKISCNEYVCRRIRRAKVLIIDEVSMLSADTLLMIEAVCREVKQKAEIFGGLQVIFVGDFFQLPPIVKNFEQDPQSSLYENKTESIFACNSIVWERARPIICYLDEQYRQDDTDFLTILSAIRANSFCESHLEKIKSRKVEKTKLPKNVPKLYSHNFNVDFVNTETLAKIEKEIETFEMSAVGHSALTTILKKGCLSPEILSLKIGAEVMFTKNNQKEGFVNGTLGTVVDFSRGTRYPIVKTRSGRTIEVEPMEWVVEENGKIRARIIQIPLRLAWAITVHKSQGMSMDSAIMDLSEVFEYGQGYVALSRVRRLSGIYLIGINEKAFKVHPEVLLKDKNFKKESAEAKKMFGEIPQDELQKMHENFIIASGGEIKVSGKIRKEKKERRWEKTLELIKSGKTIAEVAKERSRTGETIIEHLEELKKINKLPIKEINHIFAKDDSKIKKIYPVLKKMGPEPLRPIFDHFKGQFSYETIRLARLLL